jgi:MFS family permease
MAGLVISDRTALASRLALGLAGGGIATASIALISERWDGAERARMVGLHSGFSSAFGLMFLPAEKASGRRRADLAQLWWVFLAIVALWTVAWMTNAQTSFLLSEDGFTSPRVASQVISASLATNMIVGWNYGAIRSRLAPSTILALCLTAMSAGITTIGLSHGPVTAAIGCGATGAAVGALGPLFFTFISERVAPDLRGDAIGLTN